MEKVELMLLEIYINLIRDVHLLRLLINVFCANYSPKLSKVESGNGSMLSKMDSFTCGNNSCDCLYSHIIIMTIISCVKKLYLFKENKASPLLILI